MLGTYLILFLFFLFYLKDNIKGVVAIIIISLMNDMFELSFGFTITIDYFIAILYIPKLLIEYKFISKESKQLLKPLYVELFYLILLAIIFGFIIPWESKYDYLRTWSQKSQGRAIVQVFKLFSDFALMLIILLWLDKKRITIEFILKLISVTIILTTILAIIDTALNGGLKQIFFSEGRILGDRFTGFNCEPRSFGRVCSLVLLLLVTFKTIYKTKLNNISIFSSFIGLILSFSASAYLMTLIWGALFFIITKRYKNLIFGILLVLISLFFLTQNEFFRQNTLKKIEYVISNGDDNFQNERVNINEPEIFSSFEIFDRAALNFLYNEPLFFISGTGPNLISIPSSPYLTESAYSIYGDRIDSVPHTFLVNLISRSGIIGLILWFIFIIKFKNVLSGFDKELQALFICIMVSNFIVNTSMFILIIAMLLFIIQKKKINLPNIYDKYNYPSAEWSKFY